MIKNMISIGLSSILLCSSLTGIAYAGDYENYPDNGKWRDVPEMKGEDPDWSEYSQEEFENIDFSHFADGIVPDYTLNEEQLNYLEEEYPTVIYRPQSILYKEESQIEALSNSDNELIQLTIEMFEKNGMNFYLDSFHKKLLTIV